jgi:protein-S-isoprenylcysteine O-methyltransferase Ste14
MPTPLLIQLILCPLVLISLLWITAPYGRHHKAGWGPSLPNKLAWILMELPALLVITVLVLSAPDAKSPVALVPLAFWFIHYAYRTLVFPALMRPSNRTFPTLLVLFAVAFNVLNGYNNSEALVHSALQARPFPSLHFWIGSMIFVSGFLIHVHSDHIIRNLRQPGEHSYHVPEGGLFRWVSSPHYLGEIIQWTGWALMTWSLAGLAFALFTFCNLAPRALSNQSWYRDRFPDYPGKRKALIPGLF